MQAGSDPFLCSSPLVPPRCRPVHVTAFLTDHKGCVAPVLALPSLDNAQRSCFTSGFTDSARVIASDLAGLGTH